MSDGPTPEAKRIVRVAVCQVAVEIGRPEANRERCADALAVAAGAGARVAVLPELASSGYVFADRDEARTLAEPVDGPSTRRWREAAGDLGLVVVAGLCERAADGVLNSAVVIDGPTLAAVYRKTHLWDAEKSVFEPGSAIPPVVSTSAGMIAPLVCYDLEFPEIARSAAQRGAELIAAPVNWPASPRPADERPAEIVRVQALAAAHRVHVAVADRCGVERGVDWVGGSVVVGVDGFPAAGGDASETERVLVADLDFAATHDKHISERNHVLRDRRPELYAECAEPAPTPAPCSFR